MFRYSRPFAKDVVLFLAFTAGWFLWWKYRTGDRYGMTALPNYLIASVFWAALSSYTTLSILSWVGFFRPFKAQKFLPDFISFLMVMPLTGALTKPLMTAVFQIQFIRYREIMLGACLPAALGVLTEAIQSWAKGKSSVKSTIYLALTIGETERFMESLKEGGWDKFYRVLNQEEFNGALLSGGRVDYIIISRIATKNFIYHQNILRAQMLGVSILDYRVLLNQMRGHISVHDTDLWTFLAGSTRQNPLQMLYRGIKFYAEPVVAGIGLLCLTPLFLIVAIVIKTSSPGPVFFRQLRTGFHGINFELIKFRSMRTDAEAKGAQWASKTDNRVTPVGRFLRKTRIDELPQLWNVLLGEMSFMGPRPERPEFYEIIGKQVPLFKLRLLVRPGITGWAQLLGGYAASIEESEKKLEYDLYYMQYLSPRMDITILGKTVFALVKGDSGQ